MKKFLSLLVLTTLAPASLGTTSNLMAKIKLSNSLVASKLTNDNPFISKVKLNRFADSYVNSIGFSSEGTMFAGSVWKGLYKSSDEINFSIVSDIPSDAFINVITTVDNGKTIFVAAHDAGLFISQNDGKTFKKCHDITAEYVLDVKVSKNGSIFVVSDKGLFRSDDNGNSFNKINDIDGNNSGCFIFKNVIYIPSYSGLFRSDDNGNSFNKINDITAVSNFYIGNDGTMYVGKSVGVESKIGGLWISKDNGKTFNQALSLPSTSYVSSVSSLSSKVILVSTANARYITTNSGISFQKIDDLSDDVSIIVQKNNVFYLGSSNSTYFKIDINDKILQFNKPDYTSDLYDGFVYKSEQKISIMSDYIDRAVLDGKTITVPTKDLLLEAGEHLLSLTLNYKLKKYAGLFNGDTTTGIINYKFWIKTSIDRNQEISYQTTTDNVELRNELISDAGNTQNAAIIQTRSKPTGSYEASLQLLINSDMIDLSNSYFVGGTVDKANNFTATGQKQVVTKNCQIQKEGIYHLYLVDLVGNTYESYLELGYENWLLSGTFNNQALTDLANNLNVTINLVDLPSKHEAFEWLKKYQSAANQAFANSLNVNGKGFKIVIADLPKQYHTFLNPVDYIDSATKFKIDQEMLKTIISYIAQQKINNGLKNLPNNLNVDSKNVINKSTFDSYTTWITSYQNFIAGNKLKWFEELTNKVARGYATVGEIKAIEDYLNHLEFIHYLKHVVWNPEIKLDNNLNNQFQMYVEFDKFESDAAKWVNKKFPDINNNYQNAIKSAESELNLHGYTLQQLLGNHQLPQTKTEINNYLNSGKSFHNWLQSQANTNYRSFEIKLGLGIGMPIAVVAFAFGTLLNRKVRKNPFSIRKRIKK